jgi:hypothetical protein
MKVIGKSGTRKYLLEATSEEIDKLAGRSICQGSYHDERQLEYVIGTEFKVIEAFDQIHRNETRLAQVKNLRDTLNAMLTGLEMAEPFIKEPKVEEVPA